jgi:hypothetical protein
LAVLLREGAQAGILRRGSFAGKNLIAFRGIDGAPVARGEVTEAEGSDADSQEPQGGVPDGSRHFADLMVFAFGEFERDPAIGNGFSDANRRVARRERRLGLEKTGAAGERLLAAKKNAALELGEGFRGRDAFDLGPVFAQMAVGRVEKLLIEGGLVAEQEESFAVSIEAADGVDLLGKSKIGEGGPLGVGLRCELGKDAVGFVKGKKHPSVSGWVEIGALAGEAQKQKTGSKAPRF